MFCFYFVSILYCTLTVIWRSPPGRSRTLDPNFSYSKKEIKTGLESPGKLHRQVANRSP
ncbi:hypothetical protein JJD41_17285 [Oxynema sp. CENA135]|uniref:hypothetical protein n=1 Tax=Oxynema sp. CENA135 TaxID=984206 RepID=UPI00190D523C|nr:hypothetical protein [Oxynema sp. CENA135]MBK4731605.1 hypothetical protein [Oxynema sp. CENA135]